VPFRVRLSGSDAVASFEECTGLSGEQSVDLRDTEASERVPGMSMTSTINLRRGADSTGELTRWCQEARDGHIVRRDGTVEAVDSDGRPIVAFGFTRGWPRKFRAAASSAGGDDLLVEELEIEHEGLARA
jgi:phage tail-like protein